MTPLFWLRWIRRIVLAILLGTIAYIASVAIHIWVVAGEDDRPASAAIVVLGAAEYDGTPSEVFAARLDHAVLLFDEHVAPRIITVGGQEVGDVTTEAQAGRKYLVAHGIPAGDVIALPIGSDTLRNARAVGVEMHRKGWRSAVLVTDPWNCLRARTMMRDQHVSAVTSPEHSGPAVGSVGTDFRYVARETEAYIYYKIFGNDNEHSPGAV